MKKTCLLTVLSVDVLLGILFFLGIQHALLIRFGYAPLLLLNILVVFWAIQSFWRFIVGGSLSLVLLLYLGFWALSEPHRYWENDLTRFRVVRYTLFSWTGEAALDYQIFEGPIIGLGFTRCVKSEHEIFEISGVAQSTQPVLGDGISPIEEQEIRDFISMEY